LHEIDSAYIETDSIIGPITLLNSTCCGQEIVIRYSTNISSNSRYYTDDSGLEIHERIRKLPGYPFDDDAGVTIAGNFYPAVSRIFIKNDTDGQFTILSDATHGGASLTDGQLELMLHRRLLKDDGRGVGEPLNDSTIVTPKLWLVIDDNILTSTRLHRHLSNILQFPLIPVIGLTTPNNWNSIFKTSYSAINVSELPENVHLLTFENRKIQGKIVTVIRLIHMYEAREHELSKNATVHLDKLFPHFKIYAINETTLTLHTVLNSTGNKEITLNPMQIRTFTVEFLPSPGNKFDPTELIIIITSILAIFILGAILGYYYKKPKKYSNEDGLAAKLINAEN